MAMNTKGIIDKSCAITDAITNNELTVSSTGTIQPAILLRLGVFVPINKTKSIDPDKPIDVSEAFSKLQFARKEGYEKIEILGVRLNVSIDFQVWMGIIMAFSMFDKYGINQTTVKMPFTDFAKICNYPSRQINKNLRQKIFLSLRRIGTNTVSFHKKNGDKEFFTHLLNTATYDKSDDSVTLEADDRLWEIYQIDHNILVRKHHYFQLKGREVAQTIYLYIASLPDNFAPISFARIRERLNLLSEKKEQNRLIKQAITKLADIGYITCSFVRKDNEQHVIVYSRNKNIESHMQF